MVLERLARFGLLALPLAATLMLASCAGAGSGGEQGSGEQDIGESGDGMQGMDHGFGGTSSSEMLM